MKKNNQKVSIIVLNYNGSDFLEKCIQSIKKQTYSNLEIIVVDNNSTDGSIKRLKKQKNIRLIINRHNYGYSKANNIAARQSTGDLLLFLNNDTELDPSFIDYLVKKYKKNTLLAPKQLPLNPHDDREMILCGNGADLFGYAYDIKGDPNKLFFVDGAALFISRKNFFSLGGFDEKLFMFQEDLDLCWRAHLYGLNIKQSPKSIIYHYGGGAAPFGSGHSNRYTTTFFRRYHNEKNVIRNLLKNYSLPILIPILTLLLIIHLFEIVYLLFTGNLKIVKCYFDAYLWNLENLGDTLRFRHEIQSKRTISDLQILRRMQPSYYKLIAVFRYGRPHFK